MTMSAALQIECVIARCKHSVPRVVEPDREHVIVTQRIVQDLQRQVEVLRIVRVVEGDVGGLGREHGGVVPFIGRTHPVDLDRDAWLRADGIVVPARGKDRKKCGDRESSTGTDSAEQGVTSTREMTTDRGTAALIARRGHGSAEYLRINPADFDACGEVTIALCTVNPNPI